MAYPPSPVTTDLQLVAVPDTSSANWLSTRSSHCIVQPAAGLPPKAPAATSVVSASVPSSSGRRGSTEAPALMTAVGIGSTRPVISDTPPISTSASTKTTSMQLGPEPAAEARGSATPTSSTVVAATAGTSSSAADMDLSGELCKRIEALQQKNREMQASHEAALMKARSGSRLKASGARVSAGGASRSSLAGLAGARTRSLGSLARAAPQQQAPSSPAVLASTAASAASSPASSRLSDKLISRKQRAESLAQRLREFHRLIRQYEIPNAAALAQQLAQGNSQISAASLPSQPQGQSGNNGYTAIATPQNTSAARQVFAIQGDAARPAEAQATLANQQAAEAQAMLVQQQTLHQEEVLHLEEALLAQNVQREQELQARLLELEMEWEDLEDAEARVRARAAEVWSAAMTSRMDRGSAAGESFARSAPSVRSSPGSMMPGAAHMSNSQAGAEGDSLLPFAPSRLPPPQPSSPSHLPAMPHSSGTRPFPAAWAQSTSSTQMEVPGSGGRGHDDLQLPAGLPPVYEAAIAIILQHGWEMLHGGENAGPAWTALHWAASEGRPDVCDLLLQAGADAGLRDELGKTALDYALENGQITTAEILTAIPASTHVPRFSQRDAGDLWTSPLPSRQFLKCGSPQAEGRTRAAALPLALAGPAAWMRDEQCV